MPFFALQAGEQAQSATTTQNIISRPKSNLFLEKVCSGSGSNSSRQSKTNNEQQTTMCVARLVRGEADGKYVWRGRFARGEAGCGDAGGGGAGGLWRGRTVARPDVARPDVALPDAAMPVGVAKPLGVVCGEARPDVAMPDAARPAAAPVDCGEAGCGDAGCGAAGCGDAGGRGEAAWSCVWRWRGRMWRCRMWRCRMRRCRWAWRSRLELCVARPVPRE